jgi:hypothetical protein
LVIGLVHCPLLWWGCDGDLVVCYLWLPSLVVGSSDVAVVVMASCLVVFVRLLVWLLVRRMLLWLRQLLLLVRVWPWCCGCDDGLVALSVGWLLVQSLAAALPSTMLSLPLVCWVIGSLAVAARALFGFLLLQW